MFAIPLQALKKIFECKWYGVCCQSEISNSVEFFLGFITSASSEPHCLFGFSRLFANLIAVVIVGGRLEEKGQGLSFHPSTVEERKGGQRKLSTDIQLKIGKKGLGGPEG